MKISTTKGLSSTGARVYEGHVGGWLVKVWVPRTQLNATLKHTMTVTFDPLRPEPPRDVEGTTQPHD